MTYQIESMIIRKTAKTLVSRGYSIRVHNGIEYATDKTANVDDVMSECFATVLTSFVVYEADTRVGCVQFVHGNGLDVISDYSSSLEVIMIPVMEYCDKLRG